MTGPLWLPFVATHLLHIGYYVRGIFSTAEDVAYLNLTELIDWVLPELHSVKYNLS